MEVQTMSILTESMGEEIIKGQLASWLDDTDVSALLNIDEVTSLDLQNVPTKTPDYFCMPDSPLSSPYSSPELPELDSSFNMAPPLFDEQLLYPTPNQICYTNALFDFAAAKLMQ